MVVSLDGFCLGGRGGDCCQGGMRFIRDGRQLSDARGEIIQGFLQ